MIAIHPLLGQAMYWDHTCLNALVLLDLTVAVLGPDAKVAIQACTYEVMHGGKKS